MAMLLDGPPSSIEDLSARDSDLLPLAVSEGIDLSAKLRLAAADVATSIENMLTAGVSIGSPIGVPGLRHVAVTPLLKLWHTYASLRLIYQDLYFSRINDRYQAKMSLYREEEAKALDELRTCGLGIVFDPLTQAQAPSVETVAASDRGGTMYVGVAFVNRQSEEGLMSVPIEVDTQDGTAAEIRMTSFIENAVGWNLYAGVAPNILSRQNAQILDCLTTAPLAPGRLSNGTQHRNGQQANQLYPVPRRMLRG
jgi:hypothetical protein